jgi:hypothetical protein
VHVSRDRAAGRGLQQPRGAGYSGRLGQLGLGQRDPAQPVSLTVALGILTEYNPEPAG